MAIRSAPSDAALEELLDNVLAEVGPSNSGPVSEDRERIYVVRGDLVADKYLVEDLIGEGGMAFVVVAKHVKLDERVALKFLHKQFLEKADLVERFAREAQAACRIKNEHVARVYDVGTVRLQTPPVDAPFLVMEFLDGSDIDSVLRRDGAFPVGEAVELTMQACEALAVAHAQGIVHRDIKPENLFLVGAGNLRSVKVLDFGISKLALTGKAFAEAEASLTGSLTLGTPLYMSPEQIRSSRSVDPRSDIWSLGIVLYEMLTARNAFEADSVTELCAAVLEMTPKPILELRPDVPPGLAAIVARCYEKDPANRFQNVAELAIALLKYAPKRARLTAERTSQVIRAARPAAGSQHELDIPSTMPPPADHVLVMPTPAELRHAPLPSSESLDAGATTVTSRRLAPAGPTARSLRGLWIAAIVLLAGTLAGVLYLARGSKPAATPDPSAASTSSAAHPTTPTNPSGTIATPAAVTDTKPPANDPTAPRGIARPGRPIVGAHPVTGKVIAPAATSAAPVATVIAPTPAPTASTPGKRNPDLGY